MDLIRSIRIVLVINLKSCSKSVLKALECLIVVSMIWKYTFSRGIQLRIPLLNKFDGFS
jgi:hypothetical protein